MNETEMARAFREFRRENAEDHKSILKELRDVNGKVQKVQLWRARVEGVGVACLTLGTVLAGAAGALLTLAIR